MFLVFKLKRQIFMRKLLIYCLFNVLFIQKGYNQNIKDYKYLLKANVSDFVFMGRVTGEVEVPIYKNTSLSGNLGWHYKDYFYDIVEGTYNNYASLILVDELVKLFPSKRAFGFNTGLGIRQYFHIKTTNSKASYIELQYFYRNTTFKEDFKVYSNQDSGVETDFVSGKQRLNSLYFAIGKNKLLANGKSDQKMSIDMSIGCTYNFVSLNTCPDGCPVVGWLTDFIDQDDEIRDAWTASVVGRYDSAENFFKFRAAIKITFLKRKMQ